MPPTDSLGGGGGLSERLEGGELHPRSPEGCVARRVADLSGQSYLRVGSKAGAVSSMGGALGGARSIPARRCDAGQGWFVLQGSSGQIMSGFTTLAQACVVIAHGMRKVPLLPHGVELRGG